MNRLTIVALAFAAVLSVSAIGIVYAQETSPVEDATALIVAISALMSVIVGFIPAIISFLKAKTGDKKVYNDIMTGANSLKETDKWVLENQEKLATIIDVLAKLNPTFSEELAKNHPEIIKWKNEAARTKDELARLYGAVGGDKGF